MVEDDEGFLTGKEALESVASEDGEWNWVLLGRNPEKTLDGGGSGSINEMREYLIAQGRTNAYGVLRLTFGTGSFARSKKIFVIVTGSNESDVASKSKFLSIRPAMQKMAKSANTSATLMLNSIVDLSIEILVERLKGVLTIDKDVITVSYFEEAERLRKEEEERKRRAREAATLALLEAMQARDPIEIRRYAEAARKEKVSKKLLAEALALQKQIEELDDELRISLRERDFGNLPVLLERARNEQIDHRPLAKEALRAIAKLHVYELEVEFPCSSKAGPKDSASWLSNPIVNIALLEPGERADTWIRLERIGDGGDQLFGFHILRNPPSTPASCPCVIPGAPVLKEAACGSSGVAIATMEMAGAGQTFCIPSLIDLPKEGGRARFLITSTRGLRCLLLSDSRWPHEEVIQCEWSDVDNSAGGERGKHSWFKNPTFRLYLETERDDEKVCIMATVEVAPGGPDSVSLHAVKNGYKCGRSPHAAIIADTHQVLAEPQPMYQKPTVGICFEMSKSDLTIPKETSTPPIFLVPSAENPLAQSSFTLRLRSSDKLLIQRTVQTGGARNRAPQEPWRIAKGARRLTRDLS